MRHENIHMLLLPQWSLRSAGSHDPEATRTWQKKLTALRAGRVRGARVEGMTLRC
jgi:hypothetical protein